MTDAARGEPRGILCIGDPHLSPRTPGHRRDDYPRAVLEKLAWCLDLARREGLVPAILGDLFHVPRDNGNALLVDLMGRLGPAAGPGAPRTPGTPGMEVLGIAGNHDIAESRLEPGDSLSVLVAAGRLRLVSGPEGPWRGAVAGRAVAVGGTDWGSPLPERVDRAALGIEPDALVVWLAHHDVRFRGHEDAGRLDPREIPGVDVVVNGHIHRPLEPAVAGATTWLNPGNIARTTRSEASRRAPAALRIEVAPGTPGWRAERVEVPHRPFEEVFHPEPGTGAAPGAEEGGSAFVASLAALTARRTADGQSLVDFLDSNLSRYPDDVQAEVRRLAREVLHA